MPDMTEGLAGELPIKIAIGDTVITARLADNATAHDLAAQPMSATGTASSASDDSTPRWN